jgi:multidrug resistance efflux pump
MKKLSGLATRWVVLIVILILLTAGYWLFSAFYVYTGDAFLNITPFNIAAQVSGKVEHVYVHESDHVKKGQLLFTLDKVPYIRLLNEAVANYETAKLAHEQIIQTIDSYEKLYKIAQIDVKHYKKTWDAYKNLKMGVSAQTRLNAEYNYDSALVTLRKTYINWQQQKYALTADGRYPAEDYAKAAVQYAHYNLNMTKILAPTDGVVSNISLHPQEAVAVGQNLFAVINLQKGWIRARLKESYVGRIKPGDKVTVALRMYPFRFLHGHVVTVGFGVNRMEKSADVISTSALPYLSQSEDWIQLDQRFPVFIQLDDIPSDIHMRVGSSARILIHRGTAGKS